jgi:hypothetical protein
LSGEVVKTVTSAPNPTSRIRGHQRIFSRRKWLILNRRAWQKGPKAAVVKTHPILKAAVL